MNSLFKPLIDMAIYIRMFQHYLGIRMYVIFIFSTVASILEGFGILMILPLLESIGGVEGAVQEGNGLSLFIYQMINFLGLSSSTVSILLIIVIVFILKGITTMLTLTINSYLIGELLKNIKVNLFELYTNMSFSYYASKNIQDNNEKGTVAFFSLEMSSEQLSTRILSEQARISSSEIRRGKASEETLNRYIETSRNIYDLPLYIDETPAIAISTLSNRARRIKRLFGLKLIVVDYIQLMRTNSNRMDGRVQEISEITQGLKALAKELNVPVVALSQLSRAVEQRDDKIPQLSDLRESGSIEQDADVVVFVYREQYYLEKKEPKQGSIEHAEWQSKMSDIHGLASLIVGKHRHGSTGTVHVEFEGMFTKFKDLPKN